MKSKKTIIAVIFLIGLLLRVVGLNKFPAGLNADEAALGYNAWSLIETGRDEHGTPWPITFRSFDDYKPGIYVYLTIPFVYLFGLNEWSVRLPSAILGSLSILLVYYLSSKLFKKEFLPSIISTIIFATSPWSIHFSRGAWEVNAALFFILAGIYYFYESFKKPKLFVLFAVSFAISLYTYHSARIISPIIALSLLTIYRSNIFVLTKTSKFIFLGIFTGIVLSLPLATQMLSKEGQSRFSGVSIFSDSGPLWRALEQRREHPASLYNRAIHNRYISYTLKFTQNYLSHFSPRFLFLNGDEIARSKVPDTGQFFLFLSIPFFLGLYFIIKENTKFSKFILVWFFASPLAASLTFQSPHALRSQNMVVPLSLIIAFGVWSAIKSSSIKNIYISLFIVLMTYFLAIYIHQYYYVYPRQLPYAWQYGFDQISKYVKENEKGYEHIIITDRYDQPYILLAFYLHFPPQKMQSEIVMTPRDKFGFSTVRQMDKYSFKLIDFKNDIKNPNTLIISADEPVDDNYLIDTIKDPAGETMYKMLTNVKK